eukprot:990814-Pyramimonas_sp.AAC.1
MPARRRPPLRGEGQATIQTPETLRPGPHETLRAVGDDTQDLHLDARVLPLVPLQPQQVEGRRHALEPGLREVALYPDDVGVVDVREAPRRAVPAPCPAP